MITLDLAGWRLQLECQPAALADAVAARYVPFAAPEIDIASPDLTARVILEGHAREWSLLDNIRAQQDGEKYRLDAPGFSGHIDLRDHIATLALDSATPLEGVEYFIRIVYALLADHAGGMLMHAAGLLVDGRVYLFTGLSGSGKSTVVALSPHAVALNDDLIILRPDDQRWIAYSTPFWNLETRSRAGQTASGPVAGVYRLVKDVDAYLEPLPPAMAAAELVANCPVVDSLPERLPGLLARCWALTQAVPVQRLHFRKDPSFWEVLL